MKAPRGFTLLEVLVALAILAIALTAGFRAVGLATSNTEGLRERMFAQWVAENKLTEHRALNQFLDPGEYEGVAKEGKLEFRWKETVKTTPNILIRRVVVKVYGPDDPEHALITLTGYMQKVVR